LFDKCEATKTEQEKVIDYLNKHGSITADQAKAIGVNYVRSIVCKMKKDGYPIHNAKPLGTKARYELK